MLILKLEIECQGKTEVRKTNEYWQSSHGKEMTPSTGPAGTVNLGKLECDSRVLKKRDAPGGTEGTEMIEAMK